MKCVNKTGFLLDSLNLNGKFIGQLKNDSASQIIKFDNITIDSGIIPIIGIKAYIENRLITKTKMPYHCATSWKRVTEGYYIFYINYNKRIEEEYLSMALYDKIKR